MSTPSQKMLNPMTFRYLYDIVFAENVATLAIFLQ